VTRTHSPSRLLRAAALVAALAFAVLATISLALAQSPKRWSGADPKAGAELHAKDCIACHIRRVGGDGTAMYTRPDRRVTTPEKLEAQIAACNTELGTSYFPDEEAHLAAYLNLTYYKFKE
jgi:mono/diheme cytochrome c family protein